MHDFFLFSLRTTNKMALINTIFFKAPQIIHIIHYFDAQIIRSEAQSIYTL